MRNPGGILVREGGGMIGGSGKSVVNYVRRRTMLVRTVQIIFAISATHKDTLLR